MLVFEVKILLILSQKTLSNLKKILMDREKYL